MGSVGDSYDNALWKALIPAEQARVVRLLVARVIASEAGLAADPASCRPKRLR